MYNEKIEQLIKAALADGVLTEKEKQVLFKNAQASGIDLDEFEMILDARLVELQKSEKDKAEKSAPKSDKFGDVRKCPACGALLPAMTASCPDCGYEFTGIQASSSFQLLAKQISEIHDAKTKEIRKLASSAFSTTDERLTLEKSMTEAILSLIENFPIPNTKADIYDFLTALKPKVINGNMDDHDIRKAYFIKYQECLEKAKVLFPDDPRVNNFVESLPHMKKRLLVTSTGFIVAISSLVGILFLVIIGLLSYYGII